MKSIHPHGRAPIVAVAAVPPAWRWTACGSAPTRGHVLSGRAHVLSCRHRIKHCQTSGGFDMAAILQSLEKTLAAGVVLLILILVVAGLVGGIKLDYQFWVFFMLWLHVLSGVMWIGIL